MKADAEREGYVAECTGDNVFVVKRGEIFTPPILGRLAVRHHWKAVLISRRSLAEGDVQNLTRYDLYTARVFS